MRLVPFAIAAAALAGSPAFATGGMRCAPVAGHGPVIHMVIGHGVVPQPVSATLADGGRTLSTRGRPPSLSVGQSWFDAREVRLDLLDANALRFEGRLRVRVQPRLRGRPAIGTLVRAGRTYRMRCEEA